MDLLSKRVPDATVDASNTLLQSKVPLHLDLRQCLKKKNASGTQLTFPLNRIAVLNKEVECKDSKDVLGRPSLQDAG